VSLGAGSGGAKGFDLVALGRVSLDLFSTEIGAPFERIPGFDVRVGGSPSNVAIGASRLGLRSALLTAVGDDRVGDAVLARLRTEGVDTSWIARKGERRTPLALLGIEPPDRFPLLFYRENPADIWLDLDEIDAAPLRGARTLLLSGTALARGSTQAATLRAAELGRAAGVTTVLDLDLRPDQWHDERAYGVQQRALLPLIDVAIGTEEEWHAALTSEVVARVDAARRRDLDARVTAWSQRGVALVKRGERGVTLLRNGVAEEIGGFSVEVLNTVGAGDAFAAGLIYGFVRLGDWAAAVRIANACGALQVTRPGCSDTMPTLQEVERFLHERDPAAPPPQED
jgi:5-dehydro-2-deoxygluconokinase